MTMSHIEDIISRMVFACDAKNASHMSDIVGFSSGAVSQWKKRGRIPEGSIARVSSRTGVRSEWLKTGEGEMRPLSSAESASLDLQLVRTVVASVTEYLQQEELELDPDTLADLVVTLYEEFSETEEKKVNKRTVARMIKLAT